MQKYHINHKEGSVSQCRAHVHDCPFSQYDDHSDSKEEARAQYEQFLTDAADPKKSVRFIFTQKEFDAFSNGDCDHLALEFHKKKGLDPVLVGKFYNGQWDWDHMASKLPDGRIIDIQGIWTREDFARNWNAEDSDIRDFDVADYSSLRDAGERQFEESPVRAVNKIVSAIPHVLK